MGLPERPPTQHRNVIPRGGVEDAMTLRGRGKVWYGDSLTGLWTTHGKCRVVEVPRHTPVGKKQ